MERGAWGGLERALGERVVRGEPSSRHTTSRTGGPADLFVEAASADDLRDIVLLARKHRVPCFILGGGSNVLVSDAGIRGLVVLNKARQIKFQVSNLESGIHRVKVESGVILPTLARECIERGLAGLEWAIGVPGTVGGAVVGNAGAHGSDVAHSLASATILQADGAVRDWPAQELGFGYRTSRIKSQISNLKSDTFAPALRSGTSAGDRQPVSDIRTPVVLSADFDLQPGTREECEAKAAEFTEKRKLTQPPGASIGSMFKNPPGDYAGRLIETAGLKGTQVGNVKISQVHANFFVNLGGASASDIYALICLARDQVAARLGVTLELEIELMGEW